MTPGTGQCRGGKGVRTTFWGSFFLSLPSFYLSIYPSINTFSEPEAQWWLLKSKLTFMCPLCDADVGYCEFLFSSPTRNYLFLYVGGATGRREKKICSFSFTCCFFQSCAKTGPLCPGRGSYFQSAAPATSAISATLHLLSPQQQQAHVPQDLSRITC